MRGVTPWRWSRHCGTVVACLSAICVLSPVAAQYDANTLFSAAANAEADAAARPFPGGAPASQRAAFPTSSPPVTPLGSAAASLEEPDSGVRHADARSDELPREIRQLSAVAVPQRLSANDILGQPIAEIRIIGNRTIPTYAIERRITETRVGRPVISEQILKDKSSLIETHWFLSVRDRVELTEAGPAVVFEVMEAPILRSVELIGNDKGRFSPFRDEKLIAETGLVPNHGFDVAANIESVQRIKQKYIDKGYNHVEVTLKKGGHRDDREVIIEINPGPHVGVSWTAFEGNEFVRDAVLRQHIETERKLGLWFRGNYNPEVVRNDTLALKSYYEGLGFFDVDVRAREETNSDQSRVWVTYIIKEGPRYQVRNIEIAGNSVLGRQQLLKDLKLKPGDAFNSRYLQIDTQAMKDQYDSLGRPFASVTPVPRFLVEPGKMDLVYDVNEDKVCRVGTINIRIRGDQTHTRTDAVRHRINRYLEPGALARAKDIQAARTIVATDPIFDREDPPAFNIRRVTGDDYLNPTAVARGQDVTGVFTGRTNLKLSSPLLPDAGNRDAAAPLWTPPNVSELFGEGKQTVGRSLDLPIDNNSQGRQIQPLPAATDGSPHPQSTQSAPVGRSDNDLSYLAPPRRLRKEQSNSSITSAAGPSQTPDDLFRPLGSFEAVAAHTADEQSAVYRGQSLDSRGLPNPQNYLYGDSNQGDPFGNALRGTTPDFVDIDIDVTEGRTGRLMFGAGVNSNAGVVGNIVLQEDNFDITAFPRRFGDTLRGRAFRGGGQSFRLEAVPGSQVSRYTASWRTPYFLGTDFSFGVDGFYYNRFFENWTEDRLGGRLSLGYIINRYWTAGVALRLENVGFRDFLNVPQTPQLYRDVAGDNFLSTVQFRVSRDTRDSPFLPSKGNMIELAYEQAFGEFSYPRIDLTASQHFTLYERADGSGKHTLMLRGETIWTGDDTPVFERLYAGGFQSFRGFQFRGVTPRESSFRIGGQYLSLGTAEYQFPITAGDGIRGVLFTDFGTVDTKVSLDKFRASAGFGFRFFIPAMGPAPLAFDFAWPILSEPEDNEQIFSFYVGTTF